LAHQFLYSSQSIRKVSEVRSVILLPEDCESFSFSFVEHPAVIDEATHKLNVGGLSDPRMGTTYRREDSSARPVRNACRSVLNAVRHTYLP
ncbi:uncharacterized protein LAESUDRAFT_644896, partial [Laetiporus sulphureus 93-53]